MSSTGMLWVMDSKLERAMDRLLSRLLASVLFLGVIGMPVATTAGVVREDKGEDDWEILLTPYLWASAIKGTSQVGTLPPMDMDVPFGDLLSNLDMALSLHTEFHRGRWAFVIDPTWISLTLDASTEDSVVSPEADVEIWLVEAWGSYKVAENWEVLGGARWQSQDMEVDPGLPDPFPDDVSFGVKDDWLDWFVGGRFNYQLGSSRWNIVGRGDVTIAGDSDSGFNVSLFLNRHIRKTMVLNLGYRYLETDYDNYPTYVWDAYQQGPVFGYTWSF